MVVRGGWIKIRTIQPAVEGEGIMRNFTRAIPTSSLNQPVSRDTALGDSRDALL